MYAFVLSPGCRYGAGRFAEALQAEGVYARPHYITTPVFQCADWLQTKATFGASRWPFSAARETVRYDESVAPVSADILRRLILVKISESMDERDIEEVAEAIKKVATLLPSDDAR